MKSKLVNFKVTSRCIGLLVIALTFVSGSNIRNAAADPCGMVPPVYRGENPPLVRTGLQKTYVFHKDGVETFVIRPGFTGSVDQFGMLIPFPSVPSLRKVPDEIFEHVANAIDPPEVVINLTVNRMKGMMGGGGGGGGGGFGGGGMANGPAMDVLRRDEVRVIREEAVGMYEVAVLAAGSAKALKQWMGKNGFKYPDGMEQVTNEYIAQDWGFVAVKTRVAEKSGVEPRPGQKKVDDKMEPESVFNGFVQAMGFRFRSDKLVVPMRLSTFNEGELRNIVYILSDGPQRINDIDNSYVVRQISGRQLIENLTEPLPLRVIGGKARDVRATARRNLSARRDPVPKNGLAMDLFASDLLAVSSGNLNLRHEEAEKSLLRIGEFLNLRGATIDDLTTQELSSQIRKTNQLAIKKLKGMTLTVVDGDFPREVLSKQNLTFARYRMPRRLNDPVNYDAKQFGPGGKKSGVLIQTGMIQREHSRPERQLATYAVFGAVPALLLFSSLVFRRSRRNLILLIGLVTAISCGIATTNISVADAEQPQFSSALKKSVRSATGKEKHWQMPLKPITEMLAEIGSQSNSEDAIVELVADASTSKQRREKLLSDLNAIALGNRVTMELYEWSRSPADENLVRRGWAIAAMSQLDGPDTDGMLLDIHTSKKQPMLVRTWAAAARLKMTDTTAETMDRLELVDDFPALQRPFLNRLLNARPAKFDRADAERLIIISNRFPMAKAKFVDLILSGGADGLAQTMATAKDVQIRRQAAAYLATLARDDTEQVARAINTVYAFDPAAGKVPWHGGALFIPLMDWTSESGAPLVGSLITWNVWCQERGRTEEQHRIINNLNSIALANAVGYKTTRSIVATDWLQAWSKVVEKAGVEELLKKLDLHEQKKYAELIESL